ncbi:MAG: acyltransferase [Candidatus Woesearchaeota archaeon]
MFKIAREDLEKFRSSGKKILILKKVKENPARIWYKYKNPLLQAFNYSIVLFAKPLPPCEFKNHLYRLIGVKIGKKVSIAPDCILDTIFPELIRIDDDVIIGWGTKLYTHEFTQNTVRIGTIHFHNNSLVGEWSILRPGIEIGENSLIAAASFVNKDVPKNLVEGGVPIHILMHGNRK